MDNTAFASISNGESALSGARMDHMTSRSSIITEPEVQEMTKNNMQPVHPGEILADELDELEMSARALAEAIDVPTNRVTSVLNGDRAVTADTALRLGRYFGMSAEFWMNLQKTYELRLAQIEVGKNIETVVKPRIEAA